ncbi:hypothetical protein [Streptomyces liangshanensis]|uniref:hypothetical protein n=1 Tax=Streptomyces liangshanensis TaxID=2717324 RepID=UPI0036D89179
MADFTSRAGDVTFDGATVVAEGREEAGCVADVVTQPLSTPATASGTTTATGRTRGKNLMFKGIPDCHAGV